MLQRFERDKMAFTKTELAAIKSAVQEAVDAKLNVDACKDTEEGCPIGITEKHVKTLDRLTDLLDASDKTVKDTLQKIIKWAIIIGFLTLLSDKAKDIIKLFGIDKLFN